MAEEPHAEGDHPLCALTESDAREGSQTGQDAQNHDPCHMR